ncbi:DUF4270 family protein [Filimonas lacunae]|nr:DUF4270 family protein [Filimonas lacunae]
MKWTLLAVLAFFLAPSCKKVDIDYGGQYVDNSHTDIIKLDTITPVVSTVYVDSFSTAAPSSVLIGTFKDVAFGKIAASTYFEVTAPTGVTPATEATYDSLVLILKPNHTWYGDTTKPVHLNVYELDELIEPILTTDYATSGTLYNTTSFKKKNTLLGSTTVTVRPYQTDSVVVRLNGTNLGDTLFSLLKNSDDALTTSEKFRTYILKGLYIGSDATDDLILGYGDSVSMRLYYKNDGIVKEQTYTTFELSNTSHQFNHIDIDRTGTVLGNAGFNNSNNKQLYTTSTGNTAFMQYITGSMVKVRFPTLRTALTNAPNYYGIQLATLTIKPVLNTYNYPYALPASLRLSTTDIENELGSDLIYSSSSSSTVQTGNLSFSPTNLRDTRYTYDVTSYLKSLIQVTQLNNENGLLLLPPSASYTSAFDRLVLGDNANSDGQMSLVIYYMTIK